MRCSRIYSAQALHEGCDLTLEPRNNHYLINVLRIKAGAALVVFDGHGNEFDARVITVDRKSVAINIAQRRAQMPSPESPLHTTLAIAVSKGERMDWVMQKATELGVSEIQPLLTRRVDVKLDAARTDKKLQHWQAVLVGACEQCGRSVLPQLGHPAKLETWLCATAASENQARMLLQAGGLRFEEFAVQFSSAPARAQLLVGPEGGFDSSEISAAIAAGFDEVSLGPRILRTETAPLVGLSLLQHRWGDL